VSKGTGQSVDNNILKDETYNNINDILSMRGVQDSDGVVDGWYNDDNQWSEVESFLNENNINPEFVLEKSEIDASAVNDTKFSKYQLEGEKENYKEVLVTMPAKPLTFEEYKTESARGGVIFGSESRARESYNDYLKEPGKDVSKSENFKSSHFDESNILVHLRMNTRTDSEGNKVLFLEEVQSDWGQKGKKEGFANSKDEKIELSSIKEEKEYEAKGYYIQTNMNNGKTYAIKEALKGTPQAPFVTDTNAWTKLGLKVALKEAVKQGVDKMAWTTGEQQNDRYDLSKQVDSIIYAKNSDGTYRVYASKNNSKVFDEKSVQEKDLEGSFGKDVAKRITENAGEDLEQNDKLNRKVLKGDNLSVGGKGMKGFYGSPTEGSLGIVGNVAKKLFNQEPKTVKIEIGIDANEKEIIWEELGDGEQRVTVN